MLPAFFLLVGPLLLRTGEAAKAGLRRQRGAVVNSHGAVDDFNYLRHGADWTAGSCASRSRASPINFADMSQSAEGDLQYMYNKITKTFEVGSNGKSYNAHFEGLNAGGILFEGAKWELKNINIHAVSEHTFMTIHRPLELQLVHQKEGSDSQLIVAVTVECSNPPFEFLQLSNASTVRKSDASLLRIHDAKKEEPAAAAAPAPAGAPAGPAVDAGPKYVPPSAEGENFNRQIQWFVKSKLPDAKEKAQIVVDPKEPFDLNPLLQDGTFFQYAGSTTTPPCAEVVTWFVRREPIMASDAQVSMIHNGIYELTFQSGNYREALTHNGRMIAVRTGKMGEVKVPEVDPTTNDKGPNPRMDREGRAMDYANGAVDITTEAANYVQDLDQRLRAAAQAHANAIAPGLLPVTMPTTPAPLEQPKVFKPQVDAGKVANEMANSIANMAKEAITSAATQIAREAKKAAQDAAKDAKRMAREGLPPAPAPAPPPSVF